MDACLPGEDGISVLKWLKQEYGHLPVIMTSAGPEGDYGIIAVDPGADDYLAKPFSPQELLSRTGSVLRRVPEAPLINGHPQRRFCEMVHDLARRCRILSNGAEVTLTVGENRVLAAFMDQAGRTLTRTDILKIVYQDDRKVGGRTADNIISRLRKKIGDDALAANMIMTDRSDGYRFVPTVEAMPPS